MDSIPKYNQQHKNQSKSGAHKLGAVLACLLAFHIRETRKKPVTWLHRVQEFMFLSFPSALLS